MGVLGQLSFSLRVLPAARRNRLDSLRWLGSRPPLLAAMAGYELSLLASARVPPRLKELAGLKAAALVNCEFCLDVGSEFGRAEGLAEAQLRALPTFRDSEEFDQTEKLVLELAEAMTLRGPRVSRPPLSAPTDTVTCERQDREGILDMAGETLVTVAGNLTADPELRHTASGIPVAGFTVDPIPASSTASGTNSSTGSRLPALLDLAPGRRERRPVAGPGCAGHRHRPPQAAHLRRHDGRRLPGLLRWAADVSLPAPRRAVGLRGRGSR